MIYNVEFIYLTVEMFLDNLQIMVLSRELQVYNLLYKVSDYCLLTTIDIFTFNAYWSFLVLIYFYCISIL